MGYGYGMAYVTSYNRWIRKMNRYNVKDLEVGKTYWESSRNGNAEFEVLAAPYRDDVGDYEVWRCRVRYHSGEQEIAESNVYHLFGIYDNPAYIRVRTIHLDGYVDFNDGDFLNKKGKKHEQATGRNEA